jgi:hypothetical protein
VARRKKGRRWFHIDLSSLQLERNTHQ